MPTPGEIREQFDYRSHPPVTSVDLDETEESDEGTVDVDDKTE